MRELEFQGKGVVSFTRVVSQLKLVGVLVKLEDLADLSANIKVSTLLASFVEVNSFAAVGVSEELVGPLSKGSEDGGVLSLDGGLLS